MVDYPSPILSPSLKKKSVTEPLTEEDDQRGRRLGVRVHAGAALACVMSRPPVLLIAKVKGYSWWPAREEDPAKYSIFENKVVPANARGAPISICAQKHTSKRTARVCAYARSRRHHSQRCMPCTIHSANKKP